MTLSILNKEIRTVDGLFSLNDLHRSSGSAEKHKPALFLRLDKTKDLINEINQSTDVYTAVKTKRGGEKPGTYVCKELVYAYAMWISAKFSLIVIRAFDNLVTGKKQPKLGKTDSDDRVPLRQAVSQLVSSKGLLYPDAYALVHQRFGIEHIDELTHEQIPQAVEYVHTVLTGELMPRETPNKSKKSRMSGIKLMARGLIARRYQEDEIHRLAKLLEESQKQMQEIIKYNGAIHDGLPEAWHLLNFAPEEMKEAQKLAQEWFSKKFNQ